MRKFVSSEDAEFVRDAEGARRAGMSVGTFRKTAEEVGAVYQIGRTRVTNWSEFKAGLRQHYKL